MYSTSLQAIDRFICHGTRTPITLRRSDKVHVVCRLAAVETATCTRGRFVLWTDATAARPCLGGRARAKTDDAVRFDTACVSKLCISWWSRDIAWVPNTPCATQGRALINSFEIRRNRRLMTTREKREGTPCTGRASRPCGLLRVKERDGSEGVQTYIHVAYLIYLRVPNYTHT